MKNYPKRIRLKVTRKDIDNAVMDDIGKCAVARAFQRASGQKHATCGVTMVGTAGQPHYRIPQKGQNFIMRLLDTTSKAQRRKAPAIEFTVARV